MPNHKVIAPWVFGLTTLFYVFTLLPSLAWGDGVKLQSEAIAGESFVLAEMAPDQFSPDPYIFSRVGVAAWDHPLYIVMGHLLVRAFPFMDSLWLVNLLSAVFGAASVTLVFLLAFRFTGSLPVSCYASLSLAVSHTFWWHASTPEVYTLFIFLLLFSFYFFDRFESTYKHIFLAWSAFFLGLAASTHILAFLSLPALGLYLFHARRHRNFRIHAPKRLIVPAFGFLPGFCLYIIQSIRLSASFSLDELIGPVLGSTFLSQLGTFSPLLLGESLLTYVFLLTVQFSPVGLILGVLGMRKVFAAQEVLSRKLIAFFIVFALFGIFYRVTDQFTFFLASYVFWAILIGIGSGHAFGRIPEKWRLSLSIVLGLVLLATPFFYNALPRLAERYAIADDAIGIPRIGTGIRNGLAYYVNPNKRGDSSAYDFGQQTISGLAPGAVVIAQWYTDTDEYFILRYFTKVERVRSDVTVIGWPTMDPFAFDSRLALDLIVDSFAERPIYLASLSDRYYAASKLIELYCIVPEHDLYRLYPKEAKKPQCLGVDSLTE